MTDLNCVVLTGRLTRDPVVRRSESGVLLAWFTIATNRSYKDKAGAVQQETAFVPCVVFGRWAELISNRMKGEPVVTAGRLRTEVWEQDSEKRSQLTLVCEWVRAFSGLALAGPVPERKKKTVNGDHMSEKTNNSIAL